MPRDLVLLVFGVFVLIMLASMAGAMLASSRRPRRIEIVISEGK